MFLASIIVSAALALAWATRPLWSTRVVSGQARRSANVAAYRQRIAELDADAAAGLIEPATRDAMREELDQRLLDDAGDAPEARQEAPRAAVLSVLLVIVLGALAAGSYFTRGSWKTQQQIAGAADAPRPSEDEIRALVDGLAQRLESEPENLEGWIMLGRSRFQLGQYDRAAEAYARANALTSGDEPNLLVSEGEALGMARGRDLKGRPAELFQAALDLAPDNPRALWYAALAAEQAGERAQAHRHWLALSRQEVPESLRDALQERLAATAPQAGANGEAATQPDPAAVTIRLQVSVREDLASALPSETTLFVFARAAQGPPMPLAVHRGRLADLPLTVTLDDSMAMMPSMKLSQFDAWTLTARLSRSGQPQAASGDLQGSLTVARTDLGDAALSLVIDEVVP